MDYRREIDGLRALAVIPVILFHAGFQTFSGGFVGVDVFFVISGYLITTIILMELEQGKFSIVNFYERRARRILPALFLVMLACIPFAWVLLPPSELVSFSKSLVAVPLFVSNFFFWMDGGYFEIASELKPLLHTWSLAVEEQFYVLFPLFLLLFWRLGKRWILIFFAVVSIASLVLAQWGSITEPVLSFFLLPTRGWELLIGAFAAFYLSKDSGINFSRGVGEVAGWLGLGLILYSVFAYSKETPFPGLYGVVPTVGAVFVILFATQQTTVGKLLGNKVFVGIGLVSYSAYLWHQPVLAYARYLYPELGLLAKSVLIVTIFFLSILTWKLVELPFRVKNGFGRGFIFFNAIIGSILFIFFGLLISKLDFRAEDVMAKTLSINPAIYSSNINERKFIKSRIDYEQSNPSIIVLGSSRIMQIGNYIADSDVLNFGVSGASIEDNIAIWHLASKKFNPKFVLISADPWLFNVSSGQDRWKYLDSEYNSALKDLGIKNKLLDQSTPFSFIGSSYLVKFYNTVNIAKISTNDDSPSVLDKIRRDGSRVYNISYASKSRSEVEQHVGSFLSYAMSNYNYSKDTQDLFEKFILLMATKRNVVLVLSPYHPKLYDLMKNQDKKFLDIEENFKNISLRLGVKLIGSYNPATIGCNDGEFFDGMHPKDSCMKKVLSQLNK